MTRILEDRHPGENWLLWKLGNWTTIPVEWVRSRSMVSGFKWSAGAKFQWRPVFGRYYGSFYKHLGLDALFYNGAIFVRLVFPFGVFVQIRWSGHTDRRAFLQAGVGYKLNGRWGFLFRIPKSDAAATRGAWSGVDGENVSTAGWLWGPK